MSFWRSLQLSLDTEPDDDDTSFEEEMLRSALIRGYTTLPRGGRGTPSSFPPADTGDWTAIHNHRSLFQPSTIHHWQLRHLVRPVATESGEELLVMVHQKEVFAVSPRHQTEGRRCAKTVLLTSDFDPICLDAKYGYLALGGSEGQLHVFRLDDAYSEATEISKSDVCNTAVNSVQISILKDRSIALVLTSNDHELAVMGLPDMQVRYSKVFETALNYATLSPDGDRMLAVGDCFDIHLLGMSNDLETVGIYRHARDFGFCAGWHRNSLTFAAGSQDGLVNVYDARVALPEATLGGDQKLATFKSAQSSSAGAIRSLEFTRNPLLNLDLLVFAEQANRFSVVDTRSFSDRQEVDISKFALPRGFDYNIDIAGTAFSTDWSCLYVAAKSKLHVWDINAESRRSSGAFDIR